MRQSSRQSISASPTTTTTSHNIINHSSLPVTSTTIAPATDGMICFPPPGPVGYFPPPLVELCNSLGFPRTPNIPVTTNTAWSLCFSLLVTEGASDGRGEGPKPEEDVSPFRLFVPPFSALLLADFMRGAVPPPFLLAPALPPHVPPDFGVCDLTPREGGSKPPPPLDRPPMPSIEPCNCCRCGCCCCCCFGWAVVVLMLLLVLVAVRREGEKAPIKEKVCMLGGRLLTVVVVMMVINNVRVRQL